MRGGIAIVFSVLLFAGVARAEESQNKNPDLGVLKNSTFIMGPGNSTIPIHDTWKRYAQFMQFANMFDKVVQDIEAVVCGPNQNKSVLLVGEPNEFYRYIFARIASRPGSACVDMWHAEIDVQKIEAGHHFVGDVDEYWRRSILEPSDNKNIVLYLGSLGGLIGLGSHANDDTGIEREYANDISTGRLRSVAFMDKYDYNETIRSKHAYVIEAFATKLMLPPIDSLQAAELVKVYLAHLYPHLTLQPAELQYLVKMAEFYMPNRPEPERSMSVLHKLIHDSGSIEKELQYQASEIETPHPYLINTTLSWSVDMPDANEVQLAFDTFDVENNYDTLTVRDEKGNVLEVLTGAKGAFQTQFYPTNRLSLTFVSDGTGVKNGFKVNSVIGAKYTKHLFTLEETRRAVMAAAQVPQWLIDRDYSIIKNLKPKMDADVVGVTEGKADMVRLAKNGYVAGRTDDKPVATMMLAGPTGTGKSYIAKKMAEFTGQKLITIDMTSYKDPSSFATFQEVLARNLTNTPYAVYLFEEIDKASVEVLDQLYFMMDEGLFYDKYQRPLFARGAFILMTTNAASDTILANPKAPDLRALVMRDLEGHFRPSFLNRFDAVSIFLPFSDAEYLQLAHILTDKKLARIAEFFDWHMTVDINTYNYIAVNGRSAKFGARPMERLVESVLGAGIAEFQLQNSVIPAQAQISLQKMESGTHSFQITVNGASVQFDVDPSNNNLLMFKSLGLSRELQVLQQLFQDSHVNLD